MPQVTFLLGVDTLFNVADGGKLESHVQQFNVGERIELYLMDNTENGGGIFRFTPMTFSTIPITWRGDVYTPIACVADGFEVNGANGNPQPKLRVSNVGGLFGAAVITQSDLRGAVITRFITFKRFLDGQSEADPNAVLVPDVFIVSRKTTHTKEFIEWELISPIDQETVLLPRRPVLKLTCTRRYRRWNGASFDYSKAECPFNGTQNGDLMFDAAGNQVTDPALDVCGRLDGDCLLRFPQDVNNGLPTWAFPGVGSTDLR
jgi:lambda family phage minor tail protein L